MEKFTDTLVNLIIEQETPRLNNIMKEVAKKIQGDVVGVTYSVIDAFYMDYMPPERVYIRTDEYKFRHGMDKHGRKRNNKGQIVSKNTAKKSQSQTEQRRAGDRSLMSAIKSFTGNQPAIGVCRPIDGAFGYQAGVIFDEGYFEKYMRHSVKGFNEWDIVEDFLWGVHGNDSTFVTTPSAGLVLYEYINSYKTRFDIHYNSVCKKFI